MSHELYESWILSEPPLTLEQKAELDDHLQTCQQCSNLHTGWLAVEHKLSSADLTTPAPGFSQRWQNSLVERRKQKQKLTIRWLLLGLIFAAAVSLTSLVLFLSNSTALIDWWVKSAASLARFVTWFHQGRLLISSWLQQFPSFLPPLAMLLVVSSGFTLVVVLWVTVAKQFTLQGVPQQ